MNKIRVLPDNLANQIAAGEVVERPSSVIKELMENAIDAGAGRIQIEVELGGRRLMRVVDDGCGMVRDDAVLAFERHATSKISTLDDLGRIVTLGFRGEALASIASVSKVELLTKVEDDETATRVVVEGGRLVDVKDAARTRGTTISVRDLFFNTPARRKFMRSEATENYHIASIVTHYALAHPEIAFVLTSNGREVLHASPAAGLRERAFQVFGAGLIESLLPVFGGRDLVASVSGFVSAPRERRTSRDSQYFFVNRRFVRDKTIAGGLLEGYRSVLPHGVYPVAFLFIDLPVEEVDVNVHPAKTEVRFRRQEAVKDLIAEAVRKALAQGGVLPEEVPSAATEPQVASFSLEPDAAIEQARIDFRSIAEIPLTDEDKVEAADEGPVFDAPPTDDRVYDEGGSEHPSPPQQVEPASSNGSGTAARPAADVLAGLPPEAALDLPPLRSASRYARAADPADLDPARIRPLGQLHESFIIAADPEGLLLIDQHVAHERILFDKFRHSESSRAIGSQNLLLPETIDLSPAQAESFKLVEGELAALGFGVMQLSGRTVAIRCVPTDVRPSDARNLLAEVLDAVEAERRTRPKAVLRDQIAASLACKAAIKINMKLTFEKMQWLIDRLLRTSSPTTCPHGRPVVLRLSIRDIERLFDRT